LELLILSQFSYHHLLSLAIVFLIISFTLLQVLLLFIFSFNLIYLAPSLLLSLEQFRSLCIPKLYLDKPSKKSESHFQAYHEVSHMTAKGNPGHLQRVESNDPAFLCLFK